MPNILTNIQVRVNAQRAYQQIDGFGVNINAKHWNHGSLIPTINLLIDDLGACLYRVDIWGKSDWVDPASEFDARVLNEATYERVYTSDIFQSGWELIRYLNQRGIEPYLTASGDVPHWMLGEDGKTLTDFTAWAEMMASYVEWAICRENLRLRCVGLLNETDIGSPEGPTLSPEGYVAAVEALVMALDVRGLNDIPLVVAEQAHFNPDYVRAFAANGSLARRVAIIGMHTYTDLSLDTYADFWNVFQSSPYAACRLWMTEYGELEQSGEREWFVAWTMTRRLIGLLEAGFQAALAWDAYDNYHDHDEWWTLYGLLRTGLRVYTPKKRYYAAKQVYRYVRPDFVRVDAAAHSDVGLRLLAFANPSRTQTTVVGMNESDRDTFINISFDQFSDELKTQSMSYYRTSEHENGVCVGKFPVVRGEYGFGNQGFNGVAVHVPAFSIFTITNVI